MEYLCSALWSLNEQLAGREGLLLPPWRNDYLADYHALIAEAAEAPEPAREEWIDHG